MLTALNHNYRESHEPNKRSFRSNESISIPTQQYIAFTNISLSKVKTQGQKNTRHYNTHSLVIECIYYLSSYYLRYEAQCLQVQAACKKALYMNLEMKMKN